MPSNPKPSFNLILLIICVCLAACSKPKPHKPDSERYPVERLVPAIFLKF